MKTSSRISLTGFLFLWGTLFAHSQTMKPVSFHTIIDKSGVIVHGIVKSIESGTDPKSGLICTWTTIDAMEGLKGVNGKKTITFKQFGGVDKKRGVSLVTDLPILQPGQELLLCLYPNSSLGFTSPVGVTQGLFTVKRASNGNEARLDNGMPASVLFPEEPASQSASPKMKTARKANASAPLLDPCKSMRLDDVKQAISNYLSHQNPLIQVQTLQRGKIDPVKIPIKKSVHY